MNPAPRKPIHPKAAVVPVGGATAIIFVWLLTCFGVHPPGTVEAAFATLFGFAFAWKTRA